MELMRLVTKLNKPQENKSWLFNTIGFFYSIILEKIWRVVECPYPFAMPNEAT